jgi:hypothetical protein
MKCGILLLRKVHKLKSFEIIVLSKIFGSKKIKMREIREILHNEELCGLLISSPNTVRTVK